MSTDKHSKHVKITEDGRLLAMAHIDRVGDDSVVASMHVEPGHLPVGTRSGLVDAVLEDPDVQATEHLLAVVPRGDAESLDRLHERCEDVETRPAGASIMVDARVPPFSEEPLP